MKKHLLTVGLIITLLLISVQVAVAAPEFQGGGTVYNVTWGDSLSGIATRYGVSVEAILRVNGLTDPNMIYIGQPLIIPATGGYMGGQVGVACASYHTVRAGDTLSGIAWHYNTTLQQLLQMNNLYNKDVLYVGQRICVPGQQPGYAPQTGHAPQTGYMPQPASYHQTAATVYYHTVAGGETLSGIAYRYGVNYWTIMQANNLNNAVIWAGQQLIIPGQGQVDLPPAAPVYPVAHPPVAPPVYEGSYEEDDVIVVDEEIDDDTPEAPDYQASPALPSLPRSEHPIEVAVNGGENWVDDIYPTKPDPDGITTLIVQTGEEDGMTVRVRSGDAESKGESSFTGEFGAFRFVFRHIPPGDYDVWIDDPDTPSATTQVQIGAGERVEVYFRKGVNFQGQTFASPGGWRLVEWHNPSKPGLNIGGWSNIMVHTPASGLSIIAESEGGGYKAKCFTGSKGPGSCDFAGLMAGVYYIWIDGTDLKLKTYMDGDAYANFTFGHQAN
ncbi:LysM peptidoglycan-binding domain-containing protein [Chloroflexota bacterium]